MQWRDDNICDKLDIDVEYNVDDAIIRWLVNRTDRMDDDIRQSIHQLEKEVVAVRSDIAHIRELIVSSNSSMEARVVGIELRVTKHGEHLDELYVANAKITSSADANSKTNKMYLGIFTVVVLVVQAIITYVK